MVRHIYIIGAKSIGQYGGFETFVDKLTEYHQNNPHIRYHIACKANGSGHVDETKLPDPVKSINDWVFIYHNAECFKVKVPQIGAAQAIWYDVAALGYCCKHIQDNQIKHPIIYILACRIGPFIGAYKRKIKSLGGRLYVNPDGHEWMRGKWPRPVRAYWKWSEKQMIKHADIAVCDSKCIEEYIRKEYERYNPNTTYIAYGTDLDRSNIADDDPRWIRWLSKRDIKPNDYYLMVGRLVPENNFETIIREFMVSNTKRKLVIVSTPNKKLEHKLQQKYRFKEDRRIKTVGSVYHKELLKKIRENAYAYIHGHEVGGTNPSLLEALSSTKLNLLLDVGFNREVGEDAALYWNKETDNLAHHINTVEGLLQKCIDNNEVRARERISELYTWESVAGKYERLFEIVGTVY